MNTDGNGHQVKLDTVEILVLAIDSVNVFVGESKGLRGDPLEKCIVYE